MKDNNDILIVLIIMSLIIKENHSREVTGCDRKLVNKERLDFRLPDWVLSSFGGRIVHSHLKFSSFHKNAGLRLGGSAKNYEKKCKITGLGLDCQTQSARKIF